MKTPSNSKTKLVLASVNLSRGLLVAAVLSLTLGAAKADIGYQFVTVGYTYGIGKYEVTLTQYTAFLNAVANSDPYGLYNPNLGTNLNIAGIARTGSAGSYTFAVVGNGQRPVTYVSWFDAARFCNWMQNGQPTGIGEVAASTEQGAYMLNGATSGILLANPGAIFRLPTENEWYKAAYYDPTLNGGAGGYWTYATRSNSVPGNVVGGAANQANYNNGVISVTQSASYSSSQNYLTNVGAFSGSASYYGTFDQNGSAWEWNDAVLGIGSLYRGLRGAGWGSFRDDLQSQTRFNFIGPTSDGNSFGFRVAETVVPEPTGTLTGLLCLGLAAMRRRRRSVP